MSEKNIFIWAVLACVLLTELPNSVADTDVIVSQCSQEESKQEDMRCARKLLEKIKNPSADCGTELKKFMECFRNFTIDKCYGNYLKTHRNMKDPMKRMADIRAKLHNFGRLLCGIEPNINTTGLPKNVTDMLKCNKEFFDEGKECAKKFHNEFKDDRNSTDLCKLFMKAKICKGELMKKHCTFEKPPPRDRFNPFCPDMKDPRPKAGAEKAFTSVALTFMALGLYLLL